MCMDNRDRANRLRDYFEIAPPNSPVFEIEPARMTDNNNLEFP